MRMLRVKRCWREGHEGRPGWSVELHLGGDWYTDLAALKAEVPPAERSYDEGSHVWWLSDAYAEHATTLITGLAVFLHQPALFAMEE
jgi:hypothetical protein